MNVAIAGFGLEGQSNYAYYTRLGYDVTIIDERSEVSDIPAGAKTILGKDAFAKLTNFDLVVRTAGLAPQKIVTNGKIWSGTNEFFAKCKTPIIGVTGTKGKGTTSSLVESILKAAGKKTLLVGNIGKPALDALHEANEADAVVYELSSFQLWDLEKSPHVAVVLMIETDHLDVHSDFNDYVMAKANIRKHQTANDVCFYHPTNTDSQNIAFANTLPNSHKFNDSSDPVSVYVQNNWFCINGEQICSVDALQLPGVHNQENACAAISAAWVFTQDKMAIEQGLRNFGGLEHRLKFVKNVNGVLYYDDSIATTPGSAIAAMRAFLAPKILIMGGSSKGADFDEVAKVASQQSVSLVIAIGNEAPKIEQAMQKYAVKTANLGSDISMADVVTYASKVAQSGDAVVLSPACASFGMFKNYKDRGDQFINAVRSLKEHDGSAS